MIICLVCFQISIVLNSHINIINILILSSCQMLGNQPVPSTVPRGNRHKGLCCPEKVMETQRSRATSPGSPTQPTREAGRKPRSVSCQAGARSPRTFSTFQLATSASGLKGFSVAGKIGLQAALQGGRLQEADCSCYTWTAEGAMVPSLVSSGSAVTGQRGRPEGQTRESRGRDQGCPQGNIQ